MTGSDEAPRPPVLPPPVWLARWGQAMRVALPLALLAPLAFLPWPPGAGAPPLPLAWLRPLLLLAALVPAVWFGRVYARAVFAGPRVALRATFLWAAAFVWFGTSQAWQALPDPGPALAVAWVSAWVAAMAVLTWRF